MTDVTWMQENAHKRHQEVLDMIEALSDVTSSDKASSVRNVDYLSYIALILVQLHRISSGHHNR